MNEEMVLRINCDEGSVFIRKITHTQHQCSRVSDQSECFFSEPMSKMFLKLALLCLLRLVGAFADEFVKEGNSASLNSDLTEIKDDDVIQWWFENTLIAEINKRADRIAVYDDVLDGRFRDRLKLDNQTASLTITNTTTEHTGRYYQQINHVKRSFFLIVYVLEVVIKGESAFLNSDTVIKDDDVIQWRFGDENTLIAEINKRFDRFTVYDDVLDGRFRDRLKLDKQTGSLTITNTTTEHAGGYRLVINSEFKSFVLASIDEVKLLSVTEGNSVSLNSDLTEIKDDDEIQWRFGHTSIAEIYKWADRFTVYDDVLDGRFRDRLKLDKQTGSLTITHITTEHDGVYNLQINSVFKPFALFVFRLESVMEGDSVSLNSGLTEIKDDDVIQWRFGKTLIAEINKLADRFTVYDDVLDGRFRDRLKLDKQTGSLTITNTTTDHAGGYELQINSEIKRFSLAVIDEVKLVSVEEGDSVSLNSNLTEIKDDDVILWWFGVENTLIAEIDKRADRFTVYDDVLDGRFRDRLKLDKQTGSLTITHTTTEDAGDYRLQINSVFKPFALLVYGLKFVKEGDSVSLNSDTEIKDDDVILWWFGNTLIAEIYKRVDRFTVYDDVLDGRFRDRLKLDNQTGSLTITHTTTEHEGNYLLQINSVFKPFTLFVYVLESVMEGDSVSLNSDTEIKDDDVIQWRFGDEDALIAEINVTADRFTVYDDVLDGRFRDRLKLDNQTGSLTITNTTTEHAGEYRLQINSEIKTFFLTVIDEVKSVSVMKGDSVSLNSDLTEIKDDDVILWRFEDGKTLIAEIYKQADRFTVYDDVLDGRFRDRLKLDNQTGSLTITNTITGHDGGYNLLTFTGGRFSSKVFRVSVYNSVHCCGPTEAVIRLVLSALVGVATVIILV
ncbi:uncharacterized protein LOC120486365 [Pimephales promelas]|uniref:uncharacterized protein LOC120486365 n=1 Tax=Pimephales promelas TaxID=90988 RepID=UPI001955901F|nr:uncharacterized protein LOC120486365 [Pimephales promelas]